MPSVSGPQHRFMEAAEHNPQFAAAHHISQSVARDFTHADMAAGKHFSTKDKRHAVGKRLIRTYANPGAPDGG